MGCFLLSTTGTLSRSSQIFSVRIPFPLPFQPIKSVQLASKKTALINLIVLSLQASQSSPQRAFGTAIFFVYAFLVNVPEYARALDPHNSVSGRMSTFRKLVN